MKKKRFYNNKDRNKKWTEPEVGRKIYFADKYVEEGKGTNKFNQKTYKTKKPFFTKSRITDGLKYALIALCSVALVFAGYTAMDVYMQRNSMPLVEEEEEVEGGVGNVQVVVKGSRVQSLALDGGVMLNAVINDALNGGYSSVAFDVKRDDGTIGYESSLATVDAYGAEASQATDAAGSINRFSENDIMPVGIISCYKDSIFSQADPHSAVTDNGEIYKDDNGDSYLNPDSSEAYSYIKSIVEEVRAMGVSVFILTDCNLPDEISEGYNDGFDALSEKLYNDFGNEVKFIYGENVQINSDSVKDIEKETAQKFSGKDMKNTVFCIAAKDREKTKNVLDSSQQINYVISE